MEKKHGGADGGETTERQAQIVASSSILVPMVPRATASVMAQGGSGRASGPKRSPSVLRSGPSPKTSLSVSRLSTKSSEDVMRPRSQTSLARRRRGASTTAIRKDRTGDHFGESRDEIRSDFEHQMSMLMQAPKGKTTQGKVKARVMVVFMPTYRLEPVNQFRLDHVEKMMGRVLDIIADMKYDETTIPLVVQALSKCIINVTRLPSCNSDRYKLACQVRIVEKKFQGYAERFTSLWAHELDRVITAQVENHTMVATAVLTACYFD